MSNEENDATPEGEAIVSKDKIEDKEWNEQLSFFQMKTGKIISGTEYELKVYQDEKKKMEKKCQEIETKYEETIENQITYEKKILSILFIDITSNVLPYK